MLFSGRCYILCKFNNANDQYIQNFYSISIISICQRYLIYFHPSSCALFLLLKQFPSRLDQLQPVILVQSSFINQNLSPVISSFNS